MIGLREDARSPTFESRPLPPTGQDQVHDDVKVVSYNEVVLLIPTKRTRGSHGVRDWILDGRETGTRVRK